MASITNKSNAYAANFGKAYDEVPKAVFAAVVYSLLVKGMGENASKYEVIHSFLNEWMILHINDVVPQSPGRVFKAHLMSDFKEKGEK